MVRVFRLFPSIDDSLSPLLQLLGGSKFRKLRSETGKHNVTFMRIENEYTREEIMNFCSKLFESRRCKKKIGERDISCFNHS